MTTEDELLAQFAEANRRAVALQGKIDRSAAIIREGMQLRADEPDAGLEALVVGWTRYHGDQCSFKARLEAVQAERDHADKCLRDYMRLGPVEVFEQLLADRRAALASPPEPEADERPTPLSAEIREIAELWLYDGDTDQPINDGYFRALDLANRLESPKGAS